MQVTENKLKIFYVGPWRYPHLSVLESHGQARINLKFFLGYKINFLSIWPLMRPPCFPPKRSQKWHFLSFSSKVAVARQTANKEQNKVTPKTMRTTQNKKNVKYLFKNYIFDIKGKYLEISCSSYLLMIIHWILIISKALEVLDFAGICWPSSASVALDIFLKQQLAFFGKH